MRVSGLIDAVVVGAGPYGLSVAAHLAKSGISFRIFGKPMSSWRDNMPAGMFLKSAFDATSLAAPGSELSLREYCEQNGIVPLDEWHPIPIDLFIDYGLRFQQSYVPEVEAGIVTDISRDEGKFRLRLSNGEIVSTRSVISASGHMHYAEMPSELKVLAQRVPGKSLVSHSSDHVRFDSFAGKRVAVVGAGQSALESAALLREIGADVRLIVRGAALRWAGPPVASGGALYQLVKPATPLGPGWSHLTFARAPELISYLPPAIRLYLAKNTYGPSGGWWLRPRVDGRVEVIANTVVEAADEGDGKVVLHLRDRFGRVQDLKVDHVIAATGFRVDVDAVNYLAAEVRAAVARVPGSGAPRLSRTFETSVPGLYFIGLPSAATFGPVQRFVHGTQFAAQRVSHAVVRAARTRSRQPVIAEA
jgi:cation diffusion facilitator CzcD-associated flavoprotein CzcO